MAKSATIRTDRSRPSSCAGCWVHGRTEWCELDRAALALHERGREPRQFQSNQTIFAQKEIPSGVHCVESGFVLLRQLDSFGNETAFRLVTQGETIGWRAFFAKQPHAATALALTACRTCFIPEDNILKLLDNSPAFAQTLLKSLARDRGPSEALLLRSPLLPVNIRLIHLLLIVKDRCATSVPPDGLIFDLPLKRKQIAAMIGARNETLSRAIRDLGEKGLAVFDGRQVKVESQRKLLDAVERGGSAAS